VRSGESTHTSQFNRFAPNSVMLSFLLANFELSTLCLVSEKAGEKKRKPPFKFHIM
jgi:hypothetical protein